MGASMGFGYELVIDFLHGCGWCRCFYLVLLFQPFIDAVLISKYDG